MLNHPGCVFGRPRQHWQEIPWNLSKTQALNAVRKLLFKLDSRDNKAEALRRHLGDMFPPKQAKKR